MQVSARERVTPGEPIALRFAASIEAFGPFPPAPPLAVALSGGADSLALTLLAQDWVSQRGGRLVALTVDHRLRAESTAEAYQVAAIMQARGIAHAILTPQHTPITNLQETARQWRYQALADYCRAHGLLHCLIAHQAGDNRETVAHHQQRGETADGLSGMRRVRNFFGVRFVRPLLRFERDELIDFLRSKNAAWIDDPSNENTRFARVRTRKMLQQNPARAKELDALMMQESATRCARDAALAEAAVACVTISPLGFADVLLAAWRALDANLQSQLLADCITTISGSIHRPRAKDTARLVDALSGNFRKRTLQHCEITLVGDRLRIARELARVAAPLRLSGDSAAFWDGRFRVHYHLPTGTEYQLQAIGARGRRQLRALGHDLPASTPGLWHLDELVHVPHIGMPERFAGEVCVGFAPAKPLAAAPFW